MLFEGWQKTNKQYEKKSFFLSETWTPIFITVFKPHKHSNRKHPTHLWDFLGKAKSSVNLHVGGAVQKVDFYNILVLFNHSHTKEEIELSCNSIPICLFFNKSTSIIHIIYLKLTFIVSVAHWWTWPDLSRSCMTFPVASPSGLSAP